METKNPYFADRDSFDRLVQASDSNLAADLLAALGHFRLNSYLVVLNSSWVQGSNAESSGSLISFEFLAELVGWDKTLRIALVHSLADIELWLRSTVANLLSHRSQQAHVLAEHLHGGFTTKIDPQTGLSAHQLWLNNLAEKIEVRAHGPNIQLEQMSVWEVIEYSDFGALTRLIRGLKHEDREELRRISGAVDQRQMDNWFSCQNYVRNLAAHHERLWARTLVLNPSLRGFQPPEEIRLDEKNGGFLIASVIAITLSILSKNPIHGPAYTELVTTMQAYPRWIPQVSNHQIGLA